VEEDFYYALGHDLRRRIVKIIGENGFSSFTQLKKNLKVSTGTIYHHLDTLEKLITQKKNKKYYLTDLGRYAYNSLMENSRSFTNLDLEKKEFDSPLLKGLLRLTPVLPIEIDSHKRIFYFLIGLCLISAVTIFSTLTGSFTLFFFFIPSIENLSELNLFILILLAVEFISNFLIIFLIIEILIRILFKKESDIWSFWFSYTISYLPMILYLIIHFSLLSFNLLELLFFDLLDTLLLVFFQILSLWFLTYYIYQIKGVKIESSLILTLILHIGAFSVILLVSI
jgi:hypothetical protein